MRKAPLYQSFVLNLWVLSMATSGRALMGRIKRSMLTLPAIVILDQRTA